MYDIVLIISMSLVHQDKYLCCMFRDLIYRAYNVLHFEVLGFGLRAAVLQLLHEVKVEVVYRGPVTGGVWFHAMSTNHAGLLRLRHLKLCKNVDTLDRQRQTPSRTSRVMLFGWLLSRAWFMGPITMAKYTLVKGFVLVYEFCLGL